MKECWRIRIGTLSSLLLSAVCTRTSTTRVSSDRGVRHAREVRAAGSAAVPGRAAGAQGGPAQVHTQVYQNPPLKPGHRKFLSAGQLPSSSNSQKQTRTPSQSSKKWPDKGYLPRDFRRSDQTRRGRQSADTDRALREHASFKSQPRNSQNTQRLGALFPGRARSSRAGVHRR